MKNLYIVEVTDINDKKHQHYCTSIDYIDEHIINFKDLNVNESHIVATYNWRNVISYTTISVVKSEDKKYYYKEKYNIEI